MEFAEAAQEDATLLLAIKDAEINSLRQQMSQLADDMKRNLAVLSVKDEEATKLRSTVNGLRSLLAEKDNLFGQLQSQVEELDALRIEEAAKRVATEQLLASQQQDWKQQQGVAQRDKDAEITKLQQQLKELEEKWSTQLMQTRQAALDESFYRSTQQQSAIDRAAENEQRLQQQLDTAGSALAVKEAELDSAHRQLAAALEGAQRLDTSHAKAIAAKESLISQMQHQLDQQAASIAASNNDHETNMAKLIASLNQMQESCKGQVLEVQEYAAGQKRLQDERKVLKEQLKQQEVAMTKLQTEKGVLEAALQHEVTAQASTQAQLNIFQAKLTEAVVDLEKRCAAAEARSSKLMAQLVEERGRLVDAVIEQANSSTPQLAAELAKSLEADRLRTQAELQIAQERSRSLAEELSLIRSTLLPLVKAPAASAVMASGAMPAAQPPNRSLGALAQMMQQGGAPRAVNMGCTATTADAAQFPDSLGGVSCSSPGVRKHASYTFSPSPATAFSPAVAKLAAEPEHEILDQRHSPISCSQNLYAADSPCIYSNVWSPSQPGLANEPVRLNAQYINSTRSTPQRGSLAGLVCDLQADVDKLQQQLHTSRKQLRWEGQQFSDGAGEVRIKKHAGVCDRPSSAGDCQHQSSNSSPAQRQQQHHLERVREQEHHHAVSPSQHSRQQTGSAASSPANAEVAGGDQLTNALKYLLEKTQQLSVENGALKTQLEQSSPSRHALAGALSDFTLEHYAECESGLGHSSSSPYSKNRQVSDSKSRQQHKIVVNSHRRSAAASADADGSSELSNPFDDSASVHTEIRSMGDDLSVAASEELAAAQAVATAECSRRRRQVRATAAAAKQHSNSTHTVDCQQHHSPLRNVLVRSSSLGSREAQSDISSTLSATSASAADVQSSGNTRSHSSCRRLLESMLSSYPHNRLGKLMTDLVSTINTGVAAGAATAAAPCKSGSCSGRGARCGGLRSSISGKDAYSSSHTALAQEQLRRLAEMSPTRRRLLLALAGVE